MRAEIGIVFSLGFDMVYIWPKGGWFLGRALGFGCQNCEN